MAVPFGPAPVLASMTKYQDGVSLGTVNTEWFLANVWGGREFCLTSTGSWSSAYEYLASVTVAGDVRPDVKVAVFDLGNHMFTDREGVSPVTMHNIPLSLRTLIANYQLGGL